MIVMFGMVGVQGIQILQKADLNKNSNLLVASMSIGLGLGVTVYPQISSTWQPKHRLFWATGWSLAV